MNNILSEKEYYDLREKYEDDFRAAMGAEAVKELLAELDLEKLSKELKSELFNLRFQLATGQLQNTMQITAVKRDIARAKTVLRLKEQA